MPSSRMETTEFRPTRLRDVQTCPSPSHHPHELLPSPSPSPGSHIRGALSETPEIPDSRHHHTQRRVGATGQRNPTASVPTRPLSMSCQTCPLDTLISLIPVRRSLRRPTRNPHVLHDVDVDVTWCCSQIKEICNIRAIRDVGSCSPPPPPTMVAVRLSRLSRRGKLSLHL